MSDKVIRAFAPATVANVGPGFDCFGFAIEGVGDAVEVREWPEAKKRKKISLEVRGDGGKLPVKPAKNCASAVALAMLEESGADFGLKMILGKGLPLGSGLGSSGASSAAAAVAVNALLDNRYASEELIRFAALGEQVACGTAHLDNVAPAILGGFVLVRQGEDVQAITVPVPEWWVAVVHPQLELPTRKARAVIPSQITLTTMTRNVSNAAALMVALMSNDLELFGRAVMSDMVVEPARAPLITNYKLVKKAALSAGAAGVSISGAGPSIFAVATDKPRAREIGQAMSAVWNALEISTEVYVSPLGARGARIIET
ncbi:homoserine kinase [Patescibacteria group bacterium]|nr:homoserine kinase [Patescibacteria group bacterium]MBU1028923.1 homoserine kinase [Patescibacteria group bacterium]